MATTASPYGFIPVKKADGTPYAGARESFLIKPSSYNENIGYGSIVMLKDGYVQLSLKTGSASGDANNFGGAANAGALGVFVGCEYVNSEGQLIFSQYFPSGTANATAYVVTDPGVTFQVQASGAVAQALLGRNTFLSATPDGDTDDVNTTTGKSKTAVSHSATDATAGLKIVGFSDRAGQSTVGDAYTDLLVKFNFAYHQFGTGDVAS
tara:strand:+ start:502 stop:1128 length:627 start_codon:yes stop_codon:yes gene_type:complete